MSERQLKIDLHRRVRERVEQLIVDTLDLYEMAELDECEALIALTDVLMKELAALMAASEGSALVCGAAVAALVQYRRGEIDNNQLSAFMARMGLR